MITTTATASLPAIVQQLKPPPSGRFVGQYQIAASLLREAVSASLLRRYQANRTLQ
jgi:hypothetical protein